MSRARDWYTLSRQAVKRNYGCDWRLFCAILAATSPNSQLKANVRLAMKAYNEIKETGTVNREHFILAHYKGLLSVIKTGRPNGRKCKALFNGLDSPRKL